MSSSELSRSSSASLRGLSWSLDTFSMFRDAPGDYRHELDSLADRIDEGDDDVKRR